MGSEAADLTFVTLLAAAVPAFDGRTMDANYELFDHTADLGVRVHGATPEALLSSAADGLYATIGELVAAGSGEERQFRLEADDRAMLLRDFLSELLHLFETKQQMVANIVCMEFSERRLELIGEARPVDLEKSSLLREVKAVTYHELELKQIPGGWEAAFIVDI